MTTETPETNGPQDQSEAPEGYPYPEKVRFEIR
jgi:hypothetical protein